MAGLTVQGPTPAVAVAVVAPTLRVVLPVASGPYPALGAVPAVVVPIPRAATVPGPED
jgi:hypothetical protein